MSPKRPKKIAPKGRTMKPAANANSAKMKAEPSSSPLKKALAMMADKEP